MARVAICFERDENTDFRIEQWASARNFSSNIGDAVEMTDDEARGFVRCFMALKGHRTGQHLASRYDPPEARVYSEDRFLEMKREHVERMRATAEVEAERLGIA